MQDAEKRNLKYVVYKITDGDPRDNSIIIAKSLTLRQAQGQLLIFHHFLQTIDSKRSECTEYIDSLREIAPYDSHPQA